MKSGLEVLNQLKIVLFSFKTAVKTPLSFNSVKMIDKLKTTFQLSLR